MSVIGISGKKQSGKDTVGKIIQIITDSPHFTNKSVKGFLKKELIKPSFENKKFADTLKDIMCIIIGCTREQLEDENFKNIELTEQWWYYDIGGYPKVILPRNYYPNQKDNEICENRYLVKPTPRLFLQLLGTEAGRQIIHPNIWVNALFSKYNNTWRALDIMDMSNKSVKRVSEIPESNWIITDMRFPNEVEAVAVRNGLLFRVESKRCSNEDKHLSETALDNFQGFDEIIQNDGTILELIQKVREILIKHNIV